MKELKVLIAENVEDDALLMLRYLGQAGYDPAWKRVQTAPDFTAALAGEPWELILCDYNMPGFSGLDALELYHGSGLDIPFFIVSGSIGEEKTVEAMRSGAHDYIMKNRMQRLGPA